MIQLLFGILFVSTDVGIASMEYLSERVLEFTSFSDTGAEFVFTEKYKDFQIIFQSMPQILYFVTMINVLQYLGVTTFLVKTFGSFLAFCLGTRPVESMVAAANIFMAIVPMSQMITASVMSAPAALVCAKLNVPEEEEEHDHNSTTREHKEEINNGVNIEDKEISGSNNVLEAITKGAQLGTAIVVSIVVHMLIYLSLVDFLNSTVNWFGNRVAIDDLSFEKLLAYILWPVAFILGIPSQDCLIIGRFLGVRAILGVGLAYIQMGQYVENKEQLVEYKTIYNDTEYMSNGDIFLPMWNRTLEGGVLQDRSVLIGTYALCGFSALPNIGIALGVLSSVAPKRLNEATRFSIRAFLVSTMASLLTACVAGKTLFADPN
ncbi:hypothetical protein FSP39_003127 [Pinctada imbricata]|uniref:Concentrative nucleoside transporter C-terminal domain-containing protein n=1 Tax=Pinctada imbricata TaxID=66713 RepID=A0AA88YNX6_PINIB|nr:hypothetical protein FSP39_003127 [Pinctada imbricata]